MQPDLRPLDGALSEGRRLRKPVWVFVEYSPDEIVVREPIFNIHGAGETLTEALSDFREVFGGYLDVLERREESLGPQLRKQLTYLREHIHRD